MHLKHCRCCFTSKNSWFLHRSPQNQPHSSSTFPLSSQVPSITTNSCEKLLDASDTSYHSHIQSSSSADFTVRKSAHLSIPPLPLQCPKLYPPPITHTHSHTRFAIELLGWSLNQLSLSHSCSHRTHAPQKFVYNTLLLNAFKILEWWLPGSVRGKRRDIS